MGLDGKRIEKPARKLRSLLKKMGAVPGPDDVHRLRTNSRRLEHALHALSLDYGRNNRWMLKHVSDLRKRAGKVRDMDVLTDYVSRMDLPDDEHDCTVRLLEYLGAQRKKHADRLDADRKQHTEKLRPRLKRSSKQLKEIGSPDRKPNLRAARQADITASALDLVSGLRSPERLTKGNLHPYRLKVKELRNLLQMAEHSDEQNFVERLGDVKDTIGEWHDWEELLAIALEVIDHGAKCGIVQQLRKMTQQKYQKALADAETMRRQFLRVKPTGHSNAKRSANRGPVEQVWAATSRLIA